MRSCDEIVELISASLDGELTAAEQTALNEHIACCPACSALLDDLHTLHTAAAGWEEVPAPAGFTRRVMDAVAAESARETKDNVIPFPSGKAKSGYWKKWTVSAAAIAIVVLGAVSAPSLMGNFAPKSDAAMEIAYARDTVPSEALMDAVEDQSVHYVTDADSAIKTESKTEASMAEPAPGAAPGNPAEVPTSGEKPKVELYVGELILEGSLEMLEKYNGTACSDGTVVYLLPSDVFADMLELLEKEKPVGYAYTAGTPDAERGRIVVQSN